MLGLGLSLLWRQTAVAPGQSNPLNLPLAENRPTITTLLAVGDIMLSRNVSAKIERAKNPNLPFENLKAILAQADITFGNLECPLDPGKTRIREGLIFRCLTKDFEGVLDSGFDVLATANNHALDQGLDNLEFTVDYLKSQNILPVGTYKNGGLKASATSNVTDGFSLPIIESKGLKFGFLAYSYSARNDGGKSTHPQISTMNIERLKKDIENLSAKGGSASGGKSSGADIVIVSMHAGIEYTRIPNQDQIDFARAAIDAGADIVLGHHPHWIQGIEKYCPKPHLTSPYQGEETTKNSPPLQGGARGGDLPCGLIFYSLGNFVFDQMWSVETREGLMVEFEFRDKELQQAKLIPVVIDNYCCPRLADEKEKTAILKKINLDSDIISF